MSVYNFYRIIFIVLITTAIAVAGGADFFLRFKSTLPIDVSLGSIQDIFPKAQSISIHSGNKFTAYDDKQKIVGYAITSDKYAAHIKGFAGQIPLLIGHSKDSIISGISLLENHESEEYLDYVIEDNFLKSWSGISFEKAVSMEVDAITSATETSEGISKTVKTTMSKLSGRAIEVQQFSKAEIIQLVLTLLTTILGLLVCYNKNFKKYRTLFLILVVVVMGFSYQLMISVSLIHGWIIHGLPWLTNIPLVFLVILSFVLPYTTKKQFYCHYMCPYGAAQELVGKISPLKKKKSLGWLKIGEMDIQRIYTFLLIMGVIIGTYPELSFMEPFPSFSYRIVSWWMIGFGIIFILLSMIYSKPWCKICPTGFLIDSCKKSVKRNEKKYFIK